MIFPSVTYIIWCWRPLCSCDIKPTALPSKCKEKAWRKASNKKAIALACHAQANVARWIKCKKNGHLFSPTSDRVCSSDRIEPAAPAAVHVPIPVDSCTVVCERGCGIARGRWANCHWRRRWRGEQAGDVREGGATQEMVATFPLLDRFDLS